MKVFSILIVSLCIAVMTFGQSTVYTFDYSSNSTPTSSWSFFDFADQFYGNNPYTPNRIRVQNDQLIYDQSENGNDYTHAVYDIGTTLCNNWKATFEFTPTAIGTRVSGATSTAVHPIFMATAGAGNPLSISVNAQGNGRIYADMDIFGVMFFSDVNNPEECFFRPFTKDSTNMDWLTSPANDARIHVGDQTSVLNQWFRITLERVDETNAQILVEKISGPNGNVTYTYQKKCFVISKDVTNLTYIQHGNLPAAGSSKLLSAKLDNLTIEDCLYDASFTVTPPSSTNCDRITVAINDLIPGSYIDFGDGTIVNPTSLTTQHIYPASGFYTISYTIPKPCGCGLTESSEIEIDCSGSTTSTDNILNKTAFNIHPNPSNGIFRIDTQLSAGSSVDRLEIFDLNGRKIKSYYNLTEDILEVNIEEESAGVYLFRILHDNIITTKKVVLTK